MVTKSEAFNLGKDAGMNGSNMTNCHFGIFFCKENTEAWEAGKRTGSGR